MKCPCKGCVPPRRKGGCHDICKDFERWKAYMGEINKKREEDMFIRRNIYHKIQ